MPVTALAAPKLPVIRELDADDHAPGLARELVAACLDRAAADLAHTAVLLTSELVSNAVLHGRAPITVTVATAFAAFTPVPLLAGAPRVAVAVYDRGDQMAFDVTLDAAHRPALTEVAGRGLSLVAGLADRWGVIYSVDPPAGKTVWFELDTPTTGTSTSPDRPGECVFTP